MGNIRNHKRNGLAILVGFAFWIPCFAQSSLDDLAEAVKKAEAALVAAQESSDVADAEASKASDAASAAASDLSEKQKSHKDSIAAQTAASLAARIKTTASNAAKGALAAANRIKTTTEAAVTTAKSTVSTLTAAFKSATSAASSAVAALQTSEKALSSATTLEGAAKESYLEALKLSNLSPKDSKLKAAAVTAKVSYDKTVQSLRTATTAYNAAKTKEASAQKALTAAKTASDNAQTKLSAAEVAASSAAKNAASASAAAVSAAAEAASAAATLASAGEAVKSASALVSTAGKNLASAKAALAKSVVAAKSALAKLLGAKRVHSAALLKYEDALALAREVTDSTKFDFEAAFNQYTPGVIGWKSSEGSEFIFFPSSDLYSGVECSFLPAVLSGKKEQNFVALKETEHPYNSEKKGYLLFLEPFSEDFMNEIYRLSCRALNSSGEYTEQTKTIKMDIFLNGRALTSDLKGNGPCGFEADGITDNQIFSFARKVLKPTTKFGENAKVEQPYSITFSSSSGEVTALKAKFSTRKNARLSVDEKMVLVRRSMENPYWGCFLPATQKQLLNVSKGSLFWFRSLIKAYSNFGIKADAQKVGSMSLNSNAQAPYAAVADLRGRVVLIGKNPKGQLILLKTMTHGDRYLSRIFQQRNVNFPLFDVSE